MSSTNGIHRIRVGDRFLKDFKATLTEHVYVTTDDPDEAGLLPITYAVAVACFLRGLGVNATLEPLKL